MVFVLLSSVWSSERVLCSGIIIVICNLCSNELDDTYVC